MTLEEAIAGLEDLVIGAPSLGLGARTRYIRLGIEALKRVKDNRKGARVVIYKELPGETEE